MVKRSCLFLINLFLFFFLFIILNTLNPKPVIAQSCTDWWPTYSSLPSCSNALFQPNCTLSGTTTGTECCRGESVPGGPYDYCENTTVDPAPQYYFRCCSNPAPTPIPTPTSTPTPIPTPTPISCDDYNACTIDAYYGGTCNYADVTYGTLCYSSGNYSLCCDGAGSCSVNCSPTQAPTPTLTPTLAPGIPTPTPAPSLRCIPGEVITTCTTTSCGGSGNYCSEEVQQCAADGSGWFDLPPQCSWDHEICGYCYPDVTPTPTPIPTPTATPIPIPTPTPTTVPASATPAISAHCINNPNVGNEETIYWTNVPGFTADYVDISTNNSFSPYYNRGVARQPNSFVSVFTPGFTPQNFTRMPNQSPPLSLSPNTTYYVRLYDSNTGRHSPADGSPASSYPSFNQPACPIPTASPVPGQIFLSAFSSCSVPNGNRPVINLSWNNITGNTGYLINKCSGPDCTNQTPAQITRPQNVTDYTDGPFGFNATYTYNVIACLSGTPANCTRWGNYSNYATSTTPATCSGPGVTITPTPTPTPTPGPAPIGAPNPPTVTPYCGGLSATLTISRPTGTSYYQVTINGTLVSPNLPALSDPTVPSYNTTRGSSNTCGVTACNAGNLCSASTPCNFTCPNTARPWIFIDGDVHSNTRIKMSE